MPVVSVVTSVVIPVSSVTISEPSVAEVSAVLIVTADVRGVSLGMVSSPEADETFS